MIFQYFITCTTHGTWLHGDERGSYDRFGKPLSPDRLLWEKNASRMSGSPFHLTEAMQEVVREAFHEAADEKSWTIHQMTVMENHFHILLSVSGMNGELVRNLLKSKATMRLRRLRLISGKFSPWTVKGNVVNVKTHVQFAQVCEYIACHDFRDIENLKEQGNWPSDL